jgi:hypothetical protein
MTPTDGAGAMATVGPSAPRRPGALLRLVADGQLSRTNVSCCSKLTLAVSASGSQVRLGSRLSTLLIERVSAC